jgi:lysophospholipase L1-like esterase
MKSKAPLRLQIAALLIALPFASANAFAVPRVAPISEIPAGTQSIQAHTAGRVDADGSYQWPGLYFEARFKGSSIYFRTGPGDVILQIRVDGKSVGTLVKPASGAYLIDGLTNDLHVVRIDAVSENQAGKNVFNGFALPAAKTGLKVPPRKRQIEFIGDSHTVGYGNTSTTRDCTQDQVWATTDNLQAYGPKVAAHFDADYQVNAISGRGIVRNYGGFIADPLPVAYPFVLFDQGARYADSAWWPQVIVVAVGTNDFSTPLKAEEKWKTREELHADYEATYIRFVESLRARNPRAFIILWATDMAEHEIEQEAGKVVTELKARGDDNVAFIAIHGLEMTGCHWHPSVADHDAIANKLIRLIDERQLEPKAR